MAENKVTIWQPDQPAKISKSLTSPKEIASFAIQISERDRNQIISGFKSETYEMTCSYLWQRSIIILKKQLGKLGTQFIAEMLNRQDFDPDIPVEDFLTDGEAIRLAEDLGILTSTGGLRLQQSRETITHFMQKTDDFDEDEMTKSEAVSILRACVENILAKELTQSAINFQEFRNQLVTAVFDEEDTRLQILYDSPYFYQRTIVRVLMALSKSAAGAQLENALSNLNILVPLLWDKVQEPERWQIGRTYAEVVADGKLAASSAIKATLLKTKGFDYVPETLRSRSFVNIAQSLQDAHNGFDNFYNEPGPMKTLAEMGTIIPPAAFPVAMKATLCVRLGNFYGRSGAAQADAIKLLSNITKDRWKYFLESCLPTDEDLLFKISSSGRCSSNWLTLVNEFKLNEITGLKNDIKKLVQSSAEGRLPEVQAQAKFLYKKLGYKVE